MGLGFGGAANEVLAETDPACASARLLALRCLAAARLTSVDGSGRGWRRRRREIENIQDPGLWATPS